MNPFTVSVVLSLTFGVVLLEFFGANHNPLMPSTILIEPFGLYSSCWIGIGLAVPFIYNKINPQGEMV